MKQTLLTALFFALFAFQLPAQLLISGIIDGPLPGGQPKAVELYATEDIADLSLYSLDVGANGTPSTSGSITLSGSLQRGQFYYVANNSAGFQQYFGFAEDLQSGSLSFNGDDVVRLYLNVFFEQDAYGVNGVDGSGEPWEYLDGWAYRTGTGPSATFDAADWDFSGRDAVDGCTTNASCSSVMPIGTYDQAPLPVDLMSFDAERSPEGVVLQWRTARETNNDYFAVERADASAPEHFVELAQLDGQTSSASVVDYHYVDAGLGSRQGQTVYYRLRQVDRDGATSYSDVVAVSLGQQTAGEGLQLIGRNFVDAALLVRTGSASTELQVVRLDGAAVLRLDVEAGSRQHLDVSMLAPGVYVLTDGRQSRRFVKS